MATNKNVYQEIVSISEDFLGPAGERFIRRQIITHLNIEPEDVHKKQLPELVDWLRLAFAVLSNDITLVDDFGKQILSVGTSRTNVKVRHESVR